MRLVVTNNPLVKDCFIAMHLDRCYEFGWVEGYTEDVLRRIRDLCHKDYTLITHPLTGSIKPNQTPYKTVVLEKTSLPAFDREAVMLAETSLAKALAMLTDKPRSGAAAAFLDDFAVIDLDFFKSYLNSATNYP